MVTPLRMDPLTHYLLDKAALWGFGGTVLTVLPSFISEIPDAAGLLGLPIVAMSLWQKYREDKRRQEIHDKLMDLVKEGGLTKDELIEILTELKK